MKKKKMETVGKIAADLRAKDIEHAPTPIDQMREQLTEFDQNIYICIEEGKKSRTGDFFVVVETKKERLMNNVLRNYFINRYSCPTPGWDQGVYKYIRKDDRIKLLWVIPSRDTCRYFMENMLLIPHEQKQLLHYVLDFEDGTLLKLSKKLNNEKQ